MDTKKAILVNYTSALSNMVINFGECVNSLGDNKDENAAIIKTLNNQIACIRDEIVLIQGAIDTYNE